MHQDLPTIMSSASAASTYSLADFEAQHKMLAQFGIIPGNVQQGQLNIPVHRKEEVTLAATRRLVQVFIADPNENVPLESSLLYSGEQKLTDATDQELFFEIDINGLLKTHNEKRVKLVDKKVKERQEFLEPAKVRDLKMVVVTVAQF